MSRRPSRISSSAFSRSETRQELCGDTAFLNSSHLKTRLSVAKLLATYRFRGTVLTAFGRRQLTITLPHLRAFAGGSDAVAAGEGLRQPHTSGTVWVSFPKRAEQAMLLCDGPPDASVTYSASRL